MSGYKEKWQINIQKVKCGGATRPGTLEPQIPGEERQWKKNEESKNAEMKERYQQVIPSHPGSPQDISIIVPCGFSKNETQKNGGEEMNTKRETRVIGPGMPLD